MKPVSTELWSDNKWVSFTLFVVIAALFALYFGSIRFARGEWDQIPFEQVVAGKARTPFQYRVLVPWVVGWAEQHVLPLPGIATGRKLAFLVEVGSIFGLLIVFRAYLMKLIKPASAASLLALTLVLVLPFNYHLSGLWMFWLWYDMPSLFFFTLGLLLLYQKKWWAFYPVFVLATLNRETSCFLTIIYAVTEVGGWGGGGASTHPLLCRRTGIQEEEFEQKHAKIAKAATSSTPYLHELFGNSNLWLFCRRHIHFPLHGLRELLFKFFPFPRQDDVRSVGRIGSLATIAAHCAVQLIIWLVIKISLSKLYAANPGVGASLNNTASNLKVLFTQPVMTLVLLSSLGYLWIPVALYYFQIRNDFVRRACLVSPLFFVVMLYSGNLPEVRIYGEMLPVILPAFLLIIVNIARTSDAQKGGQSRVDV